MLKQKVVFIDRDGTLIDEPKDKQVDDLKKLRLAKNVVPALIELKKAGFSLVMVSNQDGLGTESFLEEKFHESHKMLLDIFETQGITFDAIYICPHFSHEQCECRKPSLKLVMDYLRSGRMDFNNSYVIGDRDSDMELAKNIGINAIRYDSSSDWNAIATNLITKQRIAQVDRVTKETQITIFVNLDDGGVIDVKTGLGFFDHMLEQLAKHGNFSLKVSVKGDLYIDEHHTVEDTAIALGEALRIALGDKKGISRYGFLLPMDEALAQVAIDLSGRSYFVFEGKFSREKMGELPTELVTHFFRSFSEALGAAMNIKVNGENDHHKIESVFKAVGRSLRNAFARQGYELPTTKGLL